MYSDEVLETMIPKMSVHYVIDSGIAKVGDFENIPEKAVAADIVTSFPIVGAQGKFMPTSTSYTLYVGEARKIDELETLTDRIKNFQKDGYQQVVFTKYGVAPLRYGDAVFSTQEEMAQAIAKINEEFKSISFSVQNAESPKISN